MTDIDSNHYALLSACARINPSTQEQQLIRTLAERISNWDALVNDAEANSVAPLLYTSLRQSGFPIPVDAKRKLYALVQRTGWANELRANALVEIIDACSAKDIPLVVLKGSFLAHCIYPDPSLRTMSDIDLLAPPSQAQEVQDTLAELGYSVPQQALSRYMSEHHHLPGASLQRDGLTISVEVHHDALSGDAPASITFDNLTAPLQSYEVKGHMAQALGHQDQLRHLFHHMSEPASRLKLIWCTDIVYYAQHFNEQIDWATLAQNYPAVVNALRVVDSAMPLPEELSNFKMDSRFKALDGAGQSIQPLSSLLRLPVNERIRGLLDPSQWWLHLYYGIPPDGSLLMTRLVRHPVKIMTWVYRRMRASLLSRRN